MLRITVHDDPQSVTFQLEGGLAGTWVQELERCWQHARAAGSAQTVRFDLTEVTFIDATGKAFLAERHAEGAELVASGCMTRAVVAEIAGALNRDCRCPYSLHNVAEGAAAVCAVATNQEEIASVSNRHPNHS
jgi:anti-anti-sigma regulatory factor